MQAPEPDYPEAYWAPAAIGWIDLLRQQGAVLAEDSLVCPRQDLVSRKLDREVRELIARAEGLAERRASGEPSDAEGHFQLGAAHGLMALHLATVNGKMEASLRAAERAYRESQRALALDPNHKNARLIVGTYRYALSQMSGQVRRRDGSHERNIQMVEEATQHRGQMQALARYILLVIYKREGRYDDALEVIRQLRQQLPGNRLLRLEEGSTLLEAGRALEAQRVLEDGLKRFAADPRPLAVGELARWRYSLGSSLAAFGQLTRARDVLGSALLEPARPWVHGRIHIEIGKIADLAGDRASAIKEYEEAVRLCAGDGDEAGAREARALAKEERLPMQRPTMSTAQSNGSDSIVSLALDGSADRHQRDSNPPPS
jgi:tetratricopeptide (TPR) repeat protein